MCRSASASACVAVLGNDAPLVSTGQSLGLKCGKVSKELLVIG